MSTKKGGSSKTTGKGTKAVSKKSLANLEVMNDKSKNIKGGAMKKVNGTQDDSI
jgi:hypothetical protein